MKQIFEIPLSGVHSEHCALIVDNTLATSTLNEMKGIDNWKVDTTVPEKILEIKTNTLNEKEIIKNLNLANFNAEYIIE